MSKIKCPACGQFRSVEQVHDAETNTWRNPPCGNCNDPGWTQPADADDPLAGRGQRNGDEA